MGETVGAERPGLRRSIGLLGAMAAALAVLWLASPSSADARWTTSCNGTCGAVQVGQIRGITYPFGTTQLQALARAVYRAPYSGAQRMSAEYRIYWWNGTTRRYVLYPNQPRWTSPWVYSNQYWRDDPHAITVFPQRFHTVDLIVRWYSSTGSLIGVRTIGFDHAPDYLCGGTVYCSIQTIGGYAAIYNALGCCGPSRPAIPGHGGRSGRVKPAPPR
jgi:hypothetical protein